MFGRLAMKKLPLSAGMPALKSVLHIFVIGTLIFQRLHLLYNLQQ